MTFTEMFHVGVIVSDLDAAAAEFGELLGVSWAVPVREDLRVRTPAGGVRANVRFTYSRGGSGTPLIELIESLPGTPWWPGEGVTAVLHHIGFWTGSLGADAARLSASGAPAEVCLPGRDGTLKLFTYHQLAHGPRIELVDTARRPAVLEWVNDEGS
ncbi:MAG TPA: VOC family protein [Trebonia sp.]|jgi:hypothetical protein